MKPIQTLRFLFLTTIALSAISAVADGAKISALTVRPNPPVTGKNALDLVVTDAAGKPVVGMKFTASVSMTSMDMGTTHPAVKDAGTGHYTTTVTFAMDGPWRVTFTGAGPNGKLVKSFDFQPGAKKPWMMPADKATEGTKLPTGLQSPTKSATVSTKPDQALAPMPGTPKTGSAQPEQAMMHDAMSMPQLKEKMVVKAMPGMDRSKNAGFGQNAPMVGMMNLMMVGGSGMEGMKMPPMDMVFDEANFLENSGDQQMSAMPLGNATATGSLKVEAKLDKAVVGDNNVSITVMTKDGKPVTGAIITTSVAMTTMDMGTTHPAVKELGGGNYAAKISFSMQGPWRLTVIVAIPKAKPLTYHFEFDAK